MKIIQSTKRHKLHYAFPQFIEFDYNSTISRFNHRILSKYFEQKYGPSSEYKMLDGRRLSTLCYNTNWREEHNKKAKRLRIYVKEAKDITWALLNIKLA